MKTTFKTADLVYIALSAVLIAVCSWISIPLAVPFTMQTFAVFCVLELLGGKSGTAAIAVYILLGAAGLPVFSGFTGGIGRLLGTTGGYILGFLFTGLIYWAFCAGPSKHPAARIVALAAGLIICYAFGTAWFMYVYARQSGPIGLWTALSWCVLPFIVPDIIKLGLAYVLAGRLKKACGI